jgi:hypothetical protein
MEIGNIHIGNPWGRNGGPQTQQKPLVPLSYFGTHFRLPFITLLFPPLQIVNYNPTSGRLELDMGVSQLACIKLNTFQETLINELRQEVAAAVEAGQPVAATKARLANAENKLDNAYAARDAIMKEIGFPKNYYSYSKLAASDTNSIYRNCTIGHWNSEADYKAIHDHPKFKAWSEKNKGNNAVFISGC